MARVIGIGDTGDEVKRWQEYLATQGFKVAADGKFGPSTLAATRQMQKRLGVKADGRVGHRTTERKTTTQAVPLPTARPDMPPAPSPSAPVLAGDRTGQDAFQSSGPEADLNAMHSAASNRSWDQQMAQELQGQYYDAREADQRNQGPPEPWRPAFTDQPSQTVPPHSMDTAMMAARGVNPNFDAAGPQGDAGSAIDLTGVGQPPGAAGAQAGTVIDPVKRDALIRALLQGSGG